MTTSPPQDSPAQPTSNNAAALREELFLAIRGVRAGTITPQQGKAISDLAQVMVNCAKVEVDYLDATGSASKSHFLEEPAEPGTQALPGVTVHRIR